VKNGNRAAWRSCAAVLALLACTAAAAADSADDRRVILVTIDGVRMQEIFGGMDPVLLDAKAADSGIYDADVTKSRYWRDTPEARREALMPFFWKTLVPAGIVLGNQAKGSKVTVRNDQWFSYPGYSEILTGQPQAEIKSNDFVRYPHRTVLEYVHDTLGLGYGDVVQIGSWEGFKYAASQKDGVFLMNGARDPFPPEYSTAEIDYLVDLRKDVMQLWEESSNDVLCFRIAMAYLKKYQPRVMWLGLGQSDDWGHARRYDLVLDFLHLADREIGELWQTLQSLDAYRGKTTLIITADHGRGRTPADWAEHDAGIQGSQDIWVAMVGPDTPATGEAANVPDVTQSDVAATLLQHLGLDWKAFNPKAGPPIPGGYKAP
jgi:hypothetical protein